MAYGFTFDGHHTDEYGVYLTERPMDIVPQSRSTEVTIPGRPGRFVPNTEADVRIIQLRLAVSPSDNNRATMIANLEAFASLLDPEKGDKDLIFDDRPTRKLRARLQGESKFARQVLLGEAQIEMRAVDPPYWLATVPKVLSWTAEPSGTYTIPNVGNKSTGVRITYQPRAGNVSPNIAYSMGMGIEAYGPLAGPRLNFPGGKYVGWTGPLASGDTLIIDTAAFTVAKNGVNALEGAGGRWVGTFPSIPPGGVTVTHVDNYKAGAVIGFDLTERFT